MNHTRESVIDIVLTMASLGVLDITRSDEADAIVEQLLLYFTAVKSGELGQA